MIAKTFGYRPLRAARARPPRGRSVLAERARERWPVVTAAGVLAVVLITGLVALGASLFGQSTAAYRRQLDLARVENRTLANELSSASQELRASQAELAASQAQLATTRAQLSAGQATPQRGAASRRH